MFAVPTDDDEQSRLGRSGRCAAVLDRDVDVVLDGFRQFEVGESRGNLKLAGGAVEGEQSGVVAGNNVESEARVGAGVRVGRLRTINAQQYRSELN